MPASTRSASRRDLKEVVIDSKLPSLAKKRELKGPGNSPSKRLRVSEIADTKISSINDTKTAVSKLNRSLGIEESIPVNSLNATIPEDTQAEKLVAASSNTTRTPSGKRKQKNSEVQVAEMTPLAPRATGLKMFIGAHVSAAKGIHNSIQNCSHIGGNAFALFLKSQRKWDNPPLQDDTKNQFIKACQDSGYDASSPGATNQSSLESSLSRLAKALISALDATKTVIPVLETTCGHGTTIGGPLSHFRDLFALIPESYHSRLGICVDTCHSFAAGYDIRTPSGWNDFMTEFDQQIGLKFLRAWHLNDSKTPLGSHRDLHANIGTGFLGLRAFHNLMNDKRLEGMPMILETPIDRPVEGGAGGGSTAGAKGTTKQGKKPADESKAVKPSKAKTVEDKSVWAKEIKLLESLIGMDPESQEFLNLETSLAEEGREEREKQQNLFDQKGLKKLGGNKDIRSMLGAKKGKAQTKRKGRKKESTSSEESVDESGSE
ncbi:hypothetical protein FQN57_006160 [Myotisia sp. PD_48]|nr:hypothetical protein FQN57_006160 [Myotisia sp. PD_48]